MVEHRKYNLKTAILQYFIDKAANRLLSPGGTNLDSLSSRKHTTYVLARLKRNSPSVYICPDAFYLARLDRNLTAERRCFGRSDLARLERNYLQKAKMTQIDLSLEAYKESRQKRLVEHREYNLAKLEAKNKRQVPRPLAQISPKCHD